MDKQETFTLHIKSIAQQHQLLGCAKPKHPLFSLLRFEDYHKNEIEQRTRLISDLYQITLKKDCPCKLQYGQTSYDFDEGIMSFFSPKQVNILEPGNYVPQEGWTLAIHPDFLRTYPLDQKIKSYSFFNYAINEALILSDDEQKSVESIITQVEKELNLPIDRFSQDVIVSSIDLLLTYCNRYYNRQFITRKPNNSELLSKVENLLNRYFQNTAREKGLPTASFLASQLNLSPRYLSDCLKQLSGQTTQQIIHEKLIEQAKEILTTTQLSVGEIAYQLGFEYPQSFNKLFRAKTKLSPLEYRQSFN
ncbi:helix-turn-helix domain-containing protein [bacterium]|nr:helix-turn-helix domain-containing protein [bacterium]